MRFIVSGAYGMGNLGDEAIAIMAVRHLRDVDPHAIITVLAWDPCSFSSVHPDLGVRVGCLFSLSRFLDMHMIIPMLRGIFDVMRCDYFIWGGGGLIRNRMTWISLYLRGLKFAAVLRKKILVLAVGVEVISSKKVCAVLQVLRCSDAISARDPSSARRLSYILNRQVDIVQDGVWTFPRIQKSHHASIRFGVNLADLDGSLPVGQEREVWLSLLLSDLQNLQEQTSCEICLISSAHRDQSIMISVQKMYPHFQVCFPTSPQDFLRVVSTCDAFLGMRMHACILATRIHGLNVIALSYAQKNIDVLQHCRQLSLFSIHDLGTSSFRDALIHALQRNTATHPQDHVGFPPSLWLKRHLQLPA